MTHRTLCLLSILLTLPLYGHGYDPNPTWPLCGTDPSSYTSSSSSGTPTCPATQWSEADHVNDTFGPRLKSGEHDWHFGIDLDAEDQMPVFAVTCGRVEDLDENGSASAGLDIANNKKITLTHFRNWTCPESADDVTEFPSCENEDGSSNCYYTIYDHLSEIDSTLSDGDYVAKARYLGRTGQNVDADYGSAEAAGYYEHLHFELRDPTGAGLYRAYSATSRSQREAVHPHRLLMQSDWPDDADNFVVTLDADLTDPAQPSAEVTVEIDVTNLDPDDYELDLNRVEAEVYDVSTATPRRILQAHNAYRSSYAALPTPELDSAGSVVTYDVHPPSLDMERRVRQYSYADTTSLPYSAFFSKWSAYPVTGAGFGNGRFVSPFRLQTIYGFPNPVYDPSLSSTYDWGYHLHQQSSTNPASSDFNGLEIEAGDFNLSASSYVLRIDMKSLLGRATASDLCLRVRALDIYGNTTAWETAGSCSSVAP